MTVELYVNGKKQVLRCDKDKPLLWALREDLGLSGTKFGCGAGFCGACTVMLEGDALRSCLMPVGALKGKQVTTIEGISADRSHVVQQAWIKHQVPQCGYCQSGMIMAAVALLKQNTEPSDADIDGAMTNLCRCGTYPKVRVAIHEAAYVLRRSNATTAIRGE